MRSSLFSALILGVGCATARPPESAPVAESHAQAVTADSALPFIHDDYAGALAQARQKQLPLFVDVWAPW